ncbi:MAG: glycosyltransferase family 39 protein [Tepidisphaeraceae bacterium]
MSRAVPFILLLFTLAIVLAARIAGPSDIHDKSQPKTVAYTADMVLHGRWVLPRDMVGGPARKPPMYNWIGAPFVAAFGFDEWVLKMPAILGGVATLGLVVFMTRRMLRAQDAPSCATSAPPHLAEEKPATILDYGARPLPEVGFDEDAVRATAWLAGIIWLACYPTFSLIYIARPDMPLVAFLTGAWVLATIALTQKPDESSGETPKPRKQQTWKLALGFWLCVSGAALTKGPPALLPIIYAIVAARLIGGRWSSLRRLHFEWGLPLLVVLFGGWVWGAWRSNPTHFWDVLVGEEVTSRFSEGEPLDPYRVHKPFWLTFTWFTLKFAPWSILSGLVLLLIPPRRWLNHAMTPAMLWLAVVLIFFAIPEGKRIDYLAPAYPAAAAMAAYALVVLLRRARLGATWAGALGVGLALWFTYYQWRLSPEAVGRSGDNVKVFARDVRKVVGPDQRIVFTELGFHPLQTLIGIHETDPLPPDALAQSGWLIAPASDFPGVAPVVLSDDIPAIKEIRNATAQIHERRSGRLGLYRLPLDAGEGTTREATTTPTTWVDDQTGAR